MGAGEWTVRTPQSSLLNVVSPAPRSAWQELLALDPAATIRQTPGWLDAHCSVENYEDASRLYQTDGGRRFLLPMVRRPGLPQALTVQASLPSHWGTGGLLAEGSVRVEDVEAVWADLTTRPARRILVRPHHLSAATWRTVAPPAGVQVARKTVHVIDLEGGFEHVWQHRYEKPTRKAVRKAERSGLEVECDSSGRLLPEFYGLYLDWVTQRARRRGLPPSLMRWRARRREPLREYQAVVKALGSACRIRIARLHGRPVAGLITLIHREHADSWRGYSDIEVAGPIRANNLLLRDAIEDACQAGCRDYNMGQSGGVASLMEFKLRHGARPHDFYQYTLDRVPLMKAAAWGKDLKHRVKRLGPR